MAKVWMEHSFGSNMARLCRSLFTMLAETLERAMPLFDGDTATVMAIHRKARSIRNAERYQVFFSALTSRQIGTAFKAACRTPGVIPEFIRRCAVRVPYHLDRWRHGGARRNTS